MKPAKILALLLSFAMLLSFAACAKPNETPAPADTSVDVTDMTKRQVKLDAPATKVVALDAADCEILYALGAGDTLVGRGEYCDYPETVADISSVQSGSETNIEQIIALEPQVVIMSTMDQTTEQEEALENAGIRVAVTDAQTISDVYEAIRLIGALVGKNDEAGTLVLNMGKTFADIQDKVDSDGEKTVYFEVSPLQYGLWTAGSGTFMDELATLLGVKNAFADVEGWAEISEEQVLERDPDYIVTIAMYYGEGQTPVEEIMSRTGWENLKAIKSGDVFNADTNQVARPGPRLTDGAQALYDFFYGE
ncbi:MAG: ABC transporter substrate-binding protein, partial [Clostridiaceae bacterium]|nr:ABC transporter substrate-binding protein [Clostridiaceae bacterium]